MLTSASRQLSKALPATLALLILACGGGSADDPRPTEDMRALPGPMDMGGSDTPDMRSDLTPTEDMRQDAADMRPDPTEMGAPAEDMRPPTLDMGSSAPDMTPTATPEALALELTRDVQGVVQIEVSALDVGGELTSAPRPPRLEASSGLLDPTLEMAPGRWRAAWTPPSGVPSGMFTIEASLEGTPGASRTGLFLPEIHESWGVPEPVPGLVNTPGWEDSIEISPDARWLLVGTYSPVHLTDCVLSGQKAQPAVPYGLPDAPACNQALGPYQAPARPQMPGGDRILSGDDILHACPRLGVQGASPGEDAVLALPPVGAYGFARQPDGSFAEPFPIYFEQDGCTVAPFGFSFVSLNVMGVASLIFAFDDYRDNSSAANTENDLQFVSEVQLGQPVELGAYDIVQGQGLVATSYRPTILELMERAGGQGNPYRSAEGIWFDDEGSEDVDLYFVPTAGDLPDAQFGPAIRVGVSEEGEDDLQPFLHQGRLYFAREFNRIRSHAWTDTSGVAEAAFDEGHVELAVPRTPQDHEGAIISIGEPSLAVDEDGVRWLYFVYGARTASGSFDISVGRVRQRDPKTP